MASNMNYCVGSGQNQDDETDGVATSTSAKIIIKELQLIEYNLGKISRLTRSIQESLFEIRDRTNL